MPDTTDVTAASSTPCFTVLHLGLGSFHRAHQAVYLQRLIDAGDARWSLSGGNLRPDMAETLAALAAQGGAYTLETVSPAGEVHYQRIEALREVIPYAPGIPALVARGADPATRIVSFTVTEAGYALDDAGRLDTRVPEVAADIARALQGQAGETIYGAVCAILRARRAAQAGPLTLLNCDNLRHNGDRFRAGLRDFLAHAGLDDLAAWAEAHTRCPNAMVDRITPRPPPELRARVRAATGRDDAAPVTAESFLQWVIEDRFIAGRPGWERVGVEMVASVAPYEEAKIRILNASHSCIAWAGTLAGLQFIHEGTRTPAIHRMAWEYVTHDVIPCLSRPVAPSPVNLPAYRDVVLERFGNPAIRDTNQRVAADGFAKIPGFIAPTVRERLAQGQPIDGVAMLPALFLAFLQRWHHGLLPYAYEDQAMDPDAAHAICDAPDPVAALCADAALWGGLANDARLVDAVRRAGARVAAFLAG
ncbi:mannitol dehydrogenase family protein [Acidovorax sp. GBBC 3334]|uniref:D-arabinitol 4-dehydrogenase n=1 Tax=Acidovorax sp. GBBC 3334 TaxID=2940496 RepID=UPI0023047F46|nr:D-arabinitol 4-dehydrogenase [Acidovorax sp. GBBC 3334]MDA8454056.1 mannitol dehydrogenase family protein [Acidovorax sp. GBBC 3334]